MKRLINVVFFLVLTNGAFGQLLMDAINHTAAIKAFNKALDGIEEQPNRFFYKYAKNKYFGPDYGNDELIDVDNNMYADIEIEGEKLTFVLYKYSVSQKTFKICNQYHSSYELSKIKNSTFRYLSDDLYVLEDGTAQDEFLEYNKNTGLNFHYNLYQTQSGLNVGIGFFKPLKSDKLSAEEIALASNGTNYFDERFESAKIVAENQKKQSKINAINNTPDEGTANAFHNQNIGKVLFGNSVSEDTKYSPTQFKNKFTIDEGITAVMYLPKGMSKYIDTSKMQVNENITDYGTSSFRQVITYENTTDTFSLQIPNNALNSKTVGIFPIVLKNATRGNNLWLKSVFPQKIEDKEHPVKIEILTLQNELIAEGSYTYTPKKGAKLPYGIACDSGEEIADKAIISMKPRLMEIAIFQIGRYNKSNGLNYSVVKISIMSDWQVEHSEFGSDEYYLIVELLCKDGKGNYFVLSERFKSLDKSDTGLFDRLSNDQVNVIYCD